MVGTFTFMRAIWQLKRSQTAALEIHLAELNLTLSANNILGQRGDDSQVEGVVVMTQGTAQIREERESHFL